MLQLNPVEIAERIRRARVAMGWSQRRLAARMGLSPSAVAQWETGQTIPTLANRVDLHRLLKIAIADLVPEVNPLSVEALKDPLVFAIVEQLLALPRQVQEAMLIQLQALAQALKDAPTGDTPA